MEPLGCIRRRKFEGNEFDWWGILLWVLCDGRLVRGCTANIHSLCRMTQRQSAYSAHYEHLLLSNGCMRRKHDCGCRCLFRLGRTTSSLLLLWYFAGRQKSCSGSLLFLLGVPSILNVIVGTMWKTFCNFTPSFDERRMMQ